MFREFETSTWNRFRIVENFLSRVTKWKVDFESSTDYEHMDREVVEDLSDANAVSSKLLFSDKHLILLDVDHICSLVGSSTTGHYHLYIDKELSWRQYRRLLKALMKAGVIEKGYYKVSMKRKATFLRVPGESKKLKSGKEIFDKESDV
jgi:hypothetical protein